MNCNCKNCPYYEGTETTYEFLKGNDIDISFTLSSVITSAEYFVGLYNNKSHYQVLMKTFDELDKIGDTSYNLHIPHSVSKTLMPNVTYTLEIAFKTANGIVSTIDNSITIKILNSDLGQKI